MGTNKGKYLIILAGPTAVGKTNMSVAVAREYGAEILSCDSRQLYTNMAIGTAKPTITDMGGITHHFIDHIAVTDSYSAAKYEQEADAILSKYFDSGQQVAIMAGGTGLYIKAVLQGLDDFPPVPDHITSNLSQQLQQHGPAPLLVELARLDPITFDSIDRSNERRVLRALSVTLAAGQPYSTYLRQKQKTLDYTPVRIALTRDRSELYDRINTRVDAMMEAGLEKEVRSLEAYRQLPALQTVGYSEIFQYMDGSLTKAEAVDLIKRNTRRYAKRQLTWFRNQGEFMPWPADDISGLISHLRTITS